MHGAMRDQIIKKRVVDRAGVVEICIFGLLGKRICIQPVCQQEVHPQASLRILGSMYVQIRKCRNDDAVAEVCHRQGRIFLRQDIIDPLYHTVLHSNIAVLMNGQFLS